MNLISIILHTLFGLLFLHELLIRIKRIIHYCAKAPSTPSLQGLKHTAVRKHTLAIMNLITVFALLYVMLIEQPHVLVQYLGFFLSLIGVLTLLGWIYYYHEEQRLYRDHCERIKEKP